MEEIYEYTGVFRRKCNLVGKETEDSSIESRYL